MSIRRLRYGGRRLLNDQEGVFDVDVAPLVFVPGDTHPVLGCPLSSENRCRDAVNSVTAGIGRLACPHVSLLHQRQSIPGKNRWAVVSRLLSADTQPKWRILVMISHIAGYRQAPAMQICPSPRAPLPARPAHRWLTPRSAPAVPDWPCR